MNPGQETMDRGSTKKSMIPGTDLMKEKLQSCETLEIRHDRRGCLQECFCCITKSDFRYYNGKKKIAKSKEEFSSFVCRCCFAPCHAFDMTITDTSDDQDSTNSDNGPEEFLEVNRPFRCCLGTFKCCCNQETTIFSGDDHLGDIRESFWCCVPQFRVYDDNEQEIYVIKPPTCVNGMCINCTGPDDDTSACPYGCCMIPCDVYPTSSDEPVDRIGRMAKIPKKNFRDVFNETNYYKIDFPKEATANQKGLLLGSSMLINALYFENSE